MVLCGGEKTVCGIFLNIHLGGEEMIYTFLGFYDSRFSPVWDKYVNGPPERI